MPTQPARSVPDRGVVDIISGSFGAGHDAAAAAIAEQLAANGIRTRTWDIVALMPGGLGRLLRSGYLKQVQAAPASWRWVLDQLERHDELADLVTRTVATASRPLLDVAADGTSMFVSTHPFASQVLGRLRNEGRLEIPVTTYLTDMSVHRLWVHPGVDRHLAIHDVPALEACALGARGTETITPAVATAFRSIYSTSGAKRSARAAFGLPTMGPLALVTGGSCGIGRLEESARDIAATGGATPVVLCGTNRRLLARVRRQPEMIGLGWVEDMPRLLQAVDVVVQNAGGITSLEALATETPVLTYRCIAGHGESNAAALASAHLAHWVRSVERLAPALRAALDGYAVDPERLSAPGVAETLLGSPVVAT